MTVRVERTVALPASAEDVWEFIATPAHRAEAISVIDDYELDAPDGRAATWHVALPIPVVDRTVAVETEDVVREPPTYVEFEGRSSVVNVRGTHRIDETDDGTELTNTFVVEGRLPGVERYFERNLDRELENLETALREHLGLEAAE